MDLAAKSSALLRSKLVMRLSCVLVAVGFLVSSVVTPRARAVAVVDDVAVGAMSCAAFLESIGLPLTATVAEGAASTALVPVGITAVAGEYAAATGAAASGEAVLGSIAAGTAISTAGTIILTAAAVAACAGLAYWLYDTYLVDDVSVGTSQIVFSRSGYWIDGVYIVPFLPPNNGYSVSDILASGATLIPSGYVLSNGPYSVSFDPYGNGGYTIFWTTPSGSFSHSWDRLGSGTFYGWFKFLDADGGMGSTYSPVYIDSNGVLGFGMYQGSSDVMEYIFTAQSDDVLSVTESPDYSIPEIQPNQSMEITIPSAAPGSTLAELVETVPQQVADGTLSATYTIDTAAPTPPSISDGDVEDVDELGLPSLGEALTRRFPFSIPWDIARGITLLAAPAKTPYFEVDFYAPISGLVGGWKGSTKIVLDFSQFESLGRLSRWTSTIGFCLFLASATKRFIWTA